MTPVIQAKNLFKRYAGFAPVLRGANLEVEHGEMVAIMGPSGCGKSTMLHILGLLHAPDSGELEILGIDALKLKPEEIASFRRANLGFVMQASNLFEHSTVFENVEFPLIYEKVPPQERWERVIRALDLVRLSARVHYPSNRLSGGEQQRVAIARAMVNNPRILLADEPTGALDAKTSRLVMENFRSLCHAGGVSLVMVTHDPKMADLCDTVYSLEDGVLVCRKKGTPPFSTDSKKDFLIHSEPAVNGALVARRFPNRNDPDSLHLAQRLHTAGMLGYIYATHKNGFIDNSNGYALPLPVRRMGIIQRLWAFRLFFARARGSASLWSLWRKLPSAGNPGEGLFRRLLAFASGTLLARWSLQDDIQFFYSYGAETQATAAWAAARLLRKPFVFEILPEEISKFNKDWIVKANDADFIIGSTMCVIKEAQKLFPLLDTNKFLLVYSPPLIAPENDDLEIPEEEKKFLEILTMGSQISREGCELAIEACAGLKNAGIVFRLSIQGVATRNLRKLIKRCDLTKEVIFLGLPSIDNFGECYKTSDIFIAFPPDHSDLSLPLYIREAMIFGLGIAASKVSCGMAEAMENHQNCLICEHDNNLEELSGALTTLCDNAKERSRLGNNARKDLISLINADDATRILADKIAMAAGRNEQKSL